MGVYKGETLPFSATFSWNFTAESKDSIFLKFLPPSSEELNRAQAFAKTILS